MKQNFYTYYSQSSLDLVSVFFPVMAKIKILFLAILPGSVRKHFYKLTPQQSSCDVVQTILSDNHTGYVILNSDYSISCFNQSGAHWAADSFGVELKPNANFKELLHSVNFGGFSVFADKVLHKGEISYETNYSSTTGKPTWYSIKAQPVKKNHKNTGGICISATDITAYKIAEEEIKKLNIELDERVKVRTNELEEANHALETFSYSVSHDLRQPIRSVVGFVQLINKEHAKNFSNDLKEMFDYIEKSSKRMNSIIEDLLSLAKNGKEQLRLNEVNMSFLFSEVCNSLMYKTTHRAQIKIQPNLPIVNADKSMLQQVIVNLLGNAIKYSSKKEKPIIQIGGEEQNDEFVFYVKDNGAGFDMKNYERLFGVFQRLHDISEFEGSGIGLTMVKSIIEKHGGKVWAEGKINQGATFYFSLPKTREQGAAVAA